MDNSLLETQILLEIHLCIPSIGDIVKENKDGTIHHVYGPSIPSKNPKIVKESVIKKVIYSLENQKVYVIITYELNGNEEVNYLPDCYEQFKPCVRKKRLKNLPLQ